VITGASDPSVLERLQSRGYWPSLALRALDEKKFSTAVEQCKKYLADEPHCLAGRLIYAKALYHAGQLESAADQFYRVLALDPENIVALKYLGDLKFSSGDEMAAFANYRRILELDPHCRGVASDLAPRPAEKSRTITISRGEEKIPQAPPASLRNIPFYTETMADLYLAQGYPKLASVVYKTLLETNRHPRLLDKLAQAEDNMKEKERRTVEHVHDSD
jgi:tetratricopeptide (TPR) repeat protein